MRWKGSCHGRWCPTSPTSPSHSRSFLFRFHLTIEVDGAAGAIVNGTWHLFQSSTFGGGEGRRRRVFGPRVSTLKEYRNSETAACTHASALSTKVHLTWLASSCSHQSGLASLLISSHDCIRNQESSRNKVRTAVASGMV